MLERAPAVGGVAARRGPGGALVAWLADECRRLGVTIETGHDIGAGDLAALDDHDAVVLATGGRPGAREYEVVEGASVLDVLEAAGSLSTLVPPVVVWDPIGGPIGVALAEELGAGDHARHRRRHRRQRAVPLR